MHSIFLCKNDTFSVKNTLKTVITPINLLTLLIIIIIIYQLCEGQIIESVGRGLWGSKFLPLNTSTLLLGRVSQN
jgi:hypothetical protein